MWKQDNYIESNTQHRFGLYLQLKGTNVLPPVAAFGDIDSKLIIKKQDWERTFALPSFLPKRFRYKNLLQGGNLRMQPEPHLN